MSTGRYTLNLIRSLESLESIKVGPPRNLIHCQTYYPLLKDGVIKWTPLTSNPTIIIKNSNNKN